MDDAIRNDFLKLFFRDATDEVQRSLEDYQSLFPGHEDLIRSEFDAVVADSGHAEVGSPLETRAAAHPPRPLSKSTWPELPPEQIGPYRILERIGSGGMGDVFLAEQRGPVTRRVALKVIKLGMDTKEVIARFEAERQALALMDHPNIAKVLEAGATDEGRPFFAMEYVRGESITDYCDREKLGVDERLALFLTVCEAVQHAHQRGIIHRDLKPSNVLVSTADASALPKVIDFGVAKAINQRLTERTVYTELGRIVGTPEYMSPEQAGSDPADVDTRADVYSLGVLLYELLTGSVPFQREPSGDYASLLRLLCEQDAPAPSTRIGTLGPEQRDVAEQRAASTTTLQRQVRGDLDWITLKALEKDRNRRYASPLNLASDVRRYLGDEPVSAGPPSARYRITKFIRRHRATVAAGVTVFLALLGGLIVSIVFWLEALASQADETTARIRAESAEKLAKANEKEAKDNERKAKENLAHYQRMKDVPLAEDLLNEADRDLWPAHPDKIEDIDDWLERAKDLFARANAHRSKLKELRKNALPLLPIVQRQIDQLTALEKDRDKSRARRELAQKSKSRRAKRALAEIESKLVELGTQIKTLEADLRDKRWRFKDYEDRFLHGVFAGLVAKLDKLAGTGGVIEQIKARRERAATLEVRCFDDRKEEWERAIAAVAKNEKYRGMPALTRQLGLVPLGRDPTSTLEEFALLDSGRVPERAEDRRLQIDGESAIVLVLIPPGTFAMGAQKADKQKPNYDPQAADEESPVRDVKLDALFLAKHEMTQGQWLRVMATNPSIYRPGTPGVTLQNPVEYVSWHDCNEAMRRLGLTLPTEAQWEYAARAGTTTAWWTGQDKLSLAGSGNLADRHLRDNGGPAPWTYDLEPELEDGHSMHTAVGGFRANAFGLHNVVGNIREWCRDEHGGYERTPLPGDGLRSHRGARYRVFRGGCNYVVAAYARSAARNRHRPEVRNLQLGCRPSRVITGH